MSVVRLWTDEIEAARPEAREVIAAAFDLIQETFSTPGPPPDDPMDRAQQMRETFERFYVRVPEAVDREIAGVRCRVILPERDATGVYLHFHGGGMMIGAPDVNDTPNLDMARRFGLAVVSVAYRLAPEHPFPAGPDDGLAVAAWLLDHAADEFGSSRLLIGGESAGGYMSAAVLLRVRDELGAADRFGGANLVFGWYDLGRSPSQRGLRPHDGPDLIDPEGIRFFAESYLPGRTDDERRDPSISPLFADLRGLPPALMSVGTCDHLLDDTLMLAARWAAAGNEVDLFVAPDMPHGFQYFPCAITKSWAERSDAWFERMLATEAATAQP
jgi:acetyl esterase/lipase